MEKLYKLKNGSLISPPLYKDGILGYNRNYALLVADGYKPLVTAQSKEYGTLTYEEYDTEIREVWLDEDFNIAKERLLSQVKAQSENIYAMMLSGFSQGEKDSWARQEAGAKALLSNPETDNEDTKFVKSLAQTRGIDVMLLCQKIIQNMTIFNTKMAEVLGSQQHKEDLINSCTTIDELYALNI